MTETMPHRIVIVDDEHVAMRVYQEELELAGYEVKHYSSTSEIEPLLRGNNPELVDLFIIDIMIPPEPLYSAEKTDMGLVTGLFLAQDLRKTYSDTPIILLSNTSFESVLRASRRLTSRFEDCIYLRKGDVLPFQLADIVTRYFEERKLGRTRRHGILRRLFGSLMLQPNISGVGIDLKRLGKGE